MEIIRGELPQPSHFTRGIVRNGEGYGDGDGYGYGDGSGYGDGYGYGHGYGYGKGDGYGYGHGYGYGYGKGDGYGDCSGSGYGHGYGYGDCYVSGYGSGNWDGSGSGEADEVEMQTYLTSIIRNTIGPQAKKLESQGAVLAWWRSGKKGEPVNGGSGTIARVGLVETIPGPLQICTQHALHASKNPTCWKGQRLWIVALYPPIQEDSGKYGSLKREFLAEIKNFFN